MEGGAVTIAIGSAAVVGLIILWWYLRRRKIKGKS